MPRAKKNPQRATDGVHAAPVIDAPQRSHGERSEFVRAQQEVPPGRPAPTPTVPAQPSSGPQASLEGVLAQAQANLPPRGLGLNAPSTRPGEPVTAGAPVGPGPGPQRITGRTAKFLGLMAAMTDDPNLRRMAQRAEMKGL